MFGRASHWINHKAKQGKHFFKRAGKKVNHYVRKAVKHGRKFVRKVQHKVKKKWHKSHIYHGIQTTRKWGRGVKRWSHKTFTKKHMKSWRKNALYTAGDLIGVNDVYTVVTGKDIRTGKKASRLAAAAWVAADVIPIGKVFKVGKIAYKATKLVHVGKKTYRLVRRSKTARRVVKATKHVKHRVTHATHAGRKASHHMMKRVVHHPKAKAKTVKHRVVHSRPVRKTKAVTKYHVRHSKNKVKRISKRVKNSRTGRTVRAVTKYQVRHGKTQAKRLPKKIYHGAKAVAKTTLTNEGRQAAKKAVVQKAKRKIGNIPVPKIKRVPNHAIAGIGGHAGSHYEIKAGKLSDHIHLSKTTGHGKVKPKSHSKPKPIAKVTKNSSGRVVRFVGKGKQFTKGKHGRKELKKNVAYVAGEHDYVYTTNAEGVVDSVRPKELKLKLHKGRKPHKSNTPDKRKGATRKESDEAGHIVADLFGGSGELDNVVSQSYKVNHGQWRDMEKKWQDALNKGQKVEVDKINIKYPKGSKRPSEFHVSYSIDGGKKVERIIKNN